MYKNHQHANERNGMGSKREKNPVMSCHTRLTPMCQSSLVEFHHFSNHKNTKLCWLSLSLIFVWLISLNLETQSPKYFVRYNKFKIILKLLHTLFLDATQFSLFIIICNCKITVYKLWGVKRINNWISSYITINFCNKNSLHWSLIQSINVW